MPTIAITSQKLGVDITAQGDNSVFGHTVGDRVEGTYGTEWVYVQNSSTALSAKKWACIDENYTLYAMTSARLASGFSPTVPQIDISASRYAWVPVAGFFGSAFAKKSCAADVPLYTTSTTGAVDDTATGHYQIAGAMLISAATSDSGFYGCRFVRNPLSVKFIDADAGGL